MTDEFPPAPGQDGLTEDTARPRLELVLGLTCGATVKAFPFSLLANSPSPIRDSLDGQTVLVHFDTEAYAAWATDEQGNLLPAVTTYCFTWFGFHPTSEVFQANDESRESEQQVQPVPQ